jgi:Na+-translocating ferredoxin:NAD+ oxidoreductase subunit B
MLTVGRDRRIASRHRHPRWRLAPFRVESAYCINCDACVKACPAEFGAVLRRRFTVEIVPELCSGCGRCVPACPVDCIVEDEDWTPAPDAWWNELTGAERART